MRVWNIFLIFFLLLTTITLSVSFAPSNAQPTKALLAREYIPMKINWEEVKVVQDENGSVEERSESLELKNPTPIRGGLPYGAILDSLNGIYVYYNKGKGERGKRRNKAKDGYNLGLKWQCVEFVKRYYYEHYGHKMPKDRGHAKSFFKRGIKDGEVNEERALFQFAHWSKYKPMTGQIIVFQNNGSFGHVAIISKVEEDRIEIIEQNSTVTRREFPLEQNDAGLWCVKNRNGSEFVLGRLGLVKEIY